MVEECSTIDTEEERELAKRAVKRHKAVSDLLTNEQNEAMDKYIEALCEMQGSFVKKAFFKGCEFATSFLYSIGAFDKK